MNYGDLGAAARTVPAGGCQLTGDPSPDSYSIFGARGASIPFTSGAVQRPPGSTPAGEPARRGGLGGSAQRACREPAPQASACRLPASSPPNTCPPPAAPTPAGAPTGAPTSAPSPTSAPGTSYYCAELPAAQEKCGANVSGSSCADECPELPAGSPAPVF